MVVISKELDKIFGQQAKFLDYEISIYDLEQIKERYFMLLVSDLSTRQVKSIIRSYFKKK